jgi:hypothetical protein
MTTQNIFDLTDTWNAGGTTFTAIKMSVTDTASASGSLLMDLQVGGVSQFNVQKSGLLTVDSTVFMGGAYVGIASGNSALNYGGNDALIAGLGGVRWTGSSIDSPDTILARDAANTLAQRNGTNAQTHRWYGSYTDASNYERGYFGYVSANGTYDLGTETAGTGNARPIALRPASGQDLYLAVSGAGKIQSTGHLIWFLDNTYDIGASGATRPRALYVAGAGTFGSNVDVGTSSGLRFSTRSNISSPADGNLVLANAAFNDFSRLQFGGTTSSFPALKRNATAIDVRLADDSNYAPLNAGVITAAAGSAVIAQGYLHAQSGTAIPAGGTTGAGVRVSSTANFGVFFGSGAPTLSAAKGSLYLRSDGTTTNDRMYVNTDSATTWTAVTTAA